jgi:protoporphyrinogen IX oxidase
MFAYLKAAHIIFIVTWFAGLFYIVRLFIYNREALDKPEPENEILRDQFEIMIRRLWYGITWPSCVLALGSGLSLLAYYDVWPVWLIIKLSIVGLLFLYHLSLGAIYKNQLAGRFTHTSNQLRMWNEVATIFLIAVVVLVVVKQAISLLWGLTALALLILVLTLAIRIYRKARKG